MTAAEVLRLGELGRQCVTFDIDPEGLDEVFGIIDRQQYREELIERCILRDAPRALMKAFFGLSRHRYSKLRPMLGMPAAVGRYQRPAAAVERQIYERWIACGKSWSAQSLLKIADETDVSLRAVWDKLGKFKRLGLSDQ